MNTSYMASASQVQWIYHLYILGRIHWYHVTFTAICFCSHISPLLCRLPTLPDWHRYVWFLSCKIDNNLWVIWFLLCFFVESRSLSPSYSSLNIGIKLNCTGFYLFNGNTHPAKHTSHPTQAGFFHGCLWSTNNLASPVILCSYRLVSAINQVCCTHHHDC